MWKGDRTCNLIRSLLLWSPNIGFLMLIIIVGKTHRAKGCGSCLCLNVWSDRQVLAIALTMYSKTPNYGNWVLEQNQENDAASHGGTRTIAVWGWTKEEHVGKKTQDAGAFNKQTLGRGVCHWAHALERHYRNLISRTAFFFFCLLTALCLTSGKWFDMCSYQDTTSHHSPPKQLTWKQIEISKTVSPNHPFYLGFSWGFCYNYRKLKHLSQNVYPKKEKERQFQEDKLGLHLLWMDKQKLFGVGMGGNQWEL